MKKLIIVGYSGNFYDIVEEVSKQKIYKIIGYLDSKKYKDNNFKYLGNDIIGKKKYRNIKKLISISGVGSKIFLKKKLFNNYKKNTINLIFKKSIISAFAKLEKNSGIIIMNNTVLKSFSIIESNVFINSSCVIGHHVHIKKNTSISLGVLVGGRTTIGENSYIGMGTKIFENITIGNNVIIGSNIVIRKNIPDNSKIYY